MKKMLLLAIAASASMAVSANNAVQTRQCSNFLDVKVPAKAMKFSGTAVAANKVQRTVQQVRTLADDASLKASYDLPNMFYMGVGVDGESWYNFVAAGADIAVAHGPAFINLPFVNTSTGATQYTWSYQDPTTYENATSNNEDLELNYGYVQVNAPTLTASNGTASDEYSAASLLMFGGQSALMLDGEIPFYDNPLNVAEASGYWSLNFGIRNGVAGIDKFGIVYPQPYAPYCLSQIYVVAAVDFPMGTELTAELYTLDENLSMSDEPLATAVFTATEDYTSTADEGYVTTALLPFNVQVFDGILYQDGYVTVDSPLVILFDGNADVNTFDPMGITSIPEDPDNVDAYYAEIGAQGLEFPVYGITSGTGAEAVTSLCVYTDATFAWCFPAENAPVTNNAVAVPANGGSVTIPLESLWVAAAYTVDEDTNYDGTLSDWASYALADTESQTVLTITADALPADVEGRSCTCTLNAPGITPLQLTINQGTTGITAVAAESAAKVSVEGGNFVVTAPEAINAATVYNIAGQAVAASEIAGTTTIDGSSLAKGVYIVRFNDGSSVKVVK